MSYGSMIGNIALGVTVGLLIWQFFALLMNAGGATLGFPYPLETFERLGEYLFEGRSLYGHSVFEHVLASIKRLLIAFGLASTIGIGLGMVLGYFGRIYQIGHGACFRLPDDPRSCVASDGDSHLRFG